MIGKEISKKQQQQKAGNCRPEELCFSNLTTLGAMLAPGGRDVGLIAPWCHSAAQNSA